MIVFIESTWAPWIPFPDGIEAFNQIWPRRTEPTQKDLVESAEWAEIIARGDLRYFTMAHPLDYCRRNSDMTTSLGLWQPNREYCQKWADVCSTRLRPGQVEHVCVVVAEEGEDPAIEQLGYAQRLAAGIIQPFKI